MCLLQPVPLLVQRARDRFFTLSLNALGQLLRIVTSNTCRVKLLLQLLNRGRVCLRQFTLLRSQSTRQGFSVLRLSCIECPSLTLGLGPGIVFELSDALGCISMG